MIEPGPNPYQSPPGEPHETQPAGAEWSWFEIFGAMLGLVFMTIFVMAFIGYSPFFFAALRISWLAPGSVDVAGSWLLALVLGPVFFLIGMAWIFGWSAEK